MIALAANYDWNIKCLDIKSAFLQGKEIQRVLHLKPPVEANTAKLWLLKKALYGLNDASRKWYSKLFETLLSFGMCVSKFDEALFYYKSNVTGALEGLLAVHVDDVFAAGSNEFNKCVIERLKRAFKISLEVDKQFNFLGLQIEKLSSGIVLHQNHYINQIDSSLLSTQISLNKQRGLDKAEFDSLRSLVGQLCWVGNQSRPDICFQVCQLSVNLKSPSESDIALAKKCLIKLKSNDVKLKFNNVGGLKDCELLVFTDASFANLMDCGSQAGLMIFLRGSNGNVSPLYWRSKKIQRVVKSTSCAEAMALVAVCEMGLLLQTILQEITGVAVQIVAVTDCKKKSVYSSNNIEDKRMKIEICVLRDYLKRGDIKEIKWVDTANQLADVLTKSGVNCDKLCHAISGAEKIML